MTTEQQNNRTTEQQNNRTTERKTIQFFMLVTNRDTLLACHSIKSYEKLIPVLTNYDWKLVVYCNSLKDEFKKTYVEEWKKLDYVEIVDNVNYVNPDDLIPGTSVYSEEGWPKRVEGKFEPCGVVWTREFRKFASDFWVTVDADFEILSPDFVLMAFKMLEDQSNLVAVASDYNGPCYYFDTYSQENIYGMERYNTWFCIYKKEAQKCKTSLFYYQEVHYKLRFSFDETAKFQYDLREQFGYKMKAVDKKYRRSFIHYGSFSKNCSLDTYKKICTYRRISILSHRGLFGSSIIVDKVIRRLFKIIHKRLYTKQSIERGRLNYQSKLDE